MLYHKFFLFLCNVDFLLLREVGLRLLGDYTAESYESYKVRNCHEAVEYVS